MYFKEFLAYQVYLFARKERFDYQIYAFNRDRRCHYTKLLQIVVQLGIYPLVEELFNVGADVNGQGGYSPGGLVARSCNVRA